MTEGTAANFTVNFSEPVTTTEAVVVSWRLDGLDAAGAASDGDFQAASRLGEVSIAPGQRSVRLPITATDDAVNEAAETFRVLLLGARGGGAIAAPLLHSTPSANASIAASDPVTLRLRGPANTVREGGDAEFSVSLALTAGGAAATSGGDICVMFATEVSQSTTLAAGANPNTAANPDITVRGCDGNPVAISATSQATGGFVISAGQSSATLRIPVRFDDEDEGSALETLRVALTGATHTALSGAAALTADTTAATAMLQNVNALRTLEVSAATLTGDEDSASMPGGAEAFVNYTVRIAGEDLIEEVTASWSLSGADGANLPGAAASALARNHGGDHTPDFGAASIAEAGGGTVNADGASGTLRFPVGAPTSRTIRVPVLQDALNEGAERLALTVADPCPTTGVCTLGGGSSGGAPALQLATGERAATIPASDPAMLRITRQGSGTVVSGEGITYQVSLGNTFLNGRPVPVRASTPLMVMVPLLVDGMDSGQSFTVEVPSGQSSGQATVSDTVLSMALSGQSGRPMLSLGQASVTGAPGPSGSEAMVMAPDPNDPADRANLPAPVQTASWELTRTLPGGLEAPEGGSYEVTFTLTGSDTPAGGLRFDWSVTGRPLSDGGEAAVAADFARADGYTCGAAAVGATCTVLPSGTVRFAAGNMSQTIAIAVRDDSADNPGEGRGPGGVIRAEGFTLSFTALSGLDAGRVEYAAGSELPGALQVDIPALRA
ncbi:MAG: hypothetical protein OXU92_03340, partial [Deltaproteobacteria bacterium]|nr:hypothetical protein [Deltaproteobacteria bacterium]